MTNVIVINKTILVADKTISNNKKIGDFIIKNNGNDINKSLNKINSNNFKNSNDDRITIFTRENFLFDEYKNFKIISLLSFEYYWKFNSNNNTLNNKLNNVKREIQNNQDAKEQDFYDFAQKNKVEYIWIENVKINSKLLEIVKFDNYKLDSNYFNYKVILLDKENVILKYNKFDYKLENK